MTFEKEKIVEVANGLIRLDRIPGNPKYKWIDAVAIPQRPSAEIVGKNVLFFASHSQREGGWDNGYDRRPIAANVQRDKGWDLVVDQIDQLPLGHYLQVESIGLLTERLYQFVRKETSPYIIGVTGSVGKTTIVSFLEHMLLLSGVEVRRFYSKRLTPLGVMCHYINLVGNATRFVVMEYSAYLPEHVAQLSNLLPPTISFLTNIYDTHVMEGLFKDKKDIFKSKIRIKPVNNVGFVNDRVLYELGEPIPAGWQSFKVEECELFNPCLPPTIRTAELFKVGEIVAKQIGVPLETFYNGFKTFVPKERRILHCNFRGKNVFFHGETSGGVRLWSWFETTDDSVPWFLVEEINFADEDPNGFINLLRNVFESDKTFVLDNTNNRQLLAIGVKAKFVNRVKFREILNDIASGYIVYHKACATRDPSFLPEKYLKENWT